MLAAARRQRGLSKRAAAREAGFSEALWRQLEDGERPVAPGVTVPANPRSETLESAARAVGLEPADVFAAAHREYHAPAQPDIQIDASGVDLEELRREDPDAYQQIIDLARFHLDRARERKGR